MKLFLFIFLIFICAACQTSCRIPGSMEIRAESRWQSEKNSLFEFKSSAETIKKESESSILNNTGMTLETRVQSPEGYMRIPVEEGSFAAFLRNFPMKEADSPVLLYNGREKGNQGAHAAVFALSIEDEKLQQCTNSIIRIYAEYFYQTKQYDRLSFHISDSFEGESYKNFQEHLRIIFAYSSTLSMMKESTEISLSEIQAGDVFLKGGSLGHVVLIVDICEKENGSKAFLLAQGCIPAQEFHLLKNPLHAEDPWYYEEEVAYPFSTPEYMFSEGSLRRLNY